MRGRRGKAYGGKTYTILDFRKMIWHSLGCHSCRTTPEMVFDFDSSALRLNKKAPRLKQLTLADRRRLSKLLGMMGSQHDGEVLSAAKKANELVRTAGLCWDDVLVRSEGHSPPPPEHKKPPTYRSPPTKQSVQFYSGMEVRHHLHGPGFFVRSDGPAEAIVKFLSGDLKVLLTEIRPI